MERLIKKLSELQGAEYQGSYIGKVVWEKKQLELPLQANARLSVQRAGKTCRRIVLVLADGQEAIAQLTVTLFLAAGHDASVAAAPSAAGRLAALQNCEQMAFTTKEIAAFVRAAGDENPIHAAERPVVPGLLILQRLQEKLPAAAGISVRFRQPLYGGETIYLAKTRALWQAYSLRGLAFQANIQYFMKAGNEG